MPTTYTYSITRDTIITEALRDVGVLGRTQVASPTDITIASTALNIFIKGMMTKGVTLWKIQENVIHLTVSVSTYLMGANSTYQYDTTGAALKVRPLKILDQGNFVRANPSDPFPADTPVSLLGRNEYEMYGSKSTTGVVNSFFYDPQLTNGILSVYPTPADSLRELHLFGQMPFADMNSASDAPDYAQEWYDVLELGLARKLVLKYGCDEATEKRIEMRYRESLNDGLNFSVDEGSTYFTYDSRSR
jgi:hypothetical protein